MSTSRLEKFIYAICSMEVSDLPAPLSRIEKLWNCLITGETPDFEPQSRNEQYLMAMLGLYELNQLPTPMSRGEKLLYKIAVGETDLSDVPDYSSRYEELLKYLIENGGISGGDFEYVLHTLNQSLSTLYTTAEKPVKSAILKGQTLVNLLEPINYPKSTTENTDLKLTQQIKANTEYTVIINVSLNNATPNVSGLGFLKSGVGWVSNHSAYTSGINKIKLTTNSNVATHLRFKGGNGITIESIVLLEGDYTNVDIPYFEGMQSVKMPVLTTSNYKNLANDIFIDYGYNNDGTIDHQKHWLISDFISIEPNVSYTTRSQGATNDGVFAIAFYDKDKTFIIKKVTNNAISPTNAKFARINVRKKDKSDITEEEKNNTILYLEKITEVLPFESHKSNILTVNEPIELRGIGDVRDTLDCLTGGVTQRVGEIVLNGSEEWKSANNEDGTLRFNYTISDFKNYGYGSGGKSLINNKLPIIPFSTKSGKYGLTSWTNVLVVFTEHITLNDFKQWLSKNPITVQYELETESIKTVDLTTVDQDGQPTKLKTFNDITYVEIKADNLIPSVDMEIATKISETLSTVGPQQLDISNTQNKLGQTIDEQTENTDATMMATTEIYENL